MPTKGHGRCFGTTIETFLPEETFMNTPTSPVASLKHGIAVAAVVLLSIPGVLTAIAPIAMTLASTGAQGTATSHAVAGGSAFNGLRGG